MISQALMDIPKRPATHIQNTAPGPPMECQVLDIVKVGAFNNFILKPIHTYVQEEYLTERGKINYEKASPVLFEFQSAQYLSTGKIIGQCWNYGKDYAKA